jgi:hypothetical protein
MLGRWRRRGQKDLARQAYCGKFIRGWQMTFESWGDSMTVYLSVPLL